MTAIKNWFLEKNNLRGLWGRKLEIIKETEKAVLVEYQIDYHKYQDWIPKSCIIDEWEKETSNFAYHDYLVDTLTEAFMTGKLERKTFKSGRNKYDSTSFLHQWTTKMLIEFLTDKMIPFMNRKEWNNR